MIIVRHSQIGWDPPCRRAFLAKNSEAERSTVVHMHATRFRNSGGRRDSCTVEYAFPSPAVCGANLS